MIPRWPYFILAREVHGTAFFEKHSFQTQCKNQLLHSVAASEMMSVRARSIVLLSCYSPLSAALDVMCGAFNAQIVGATLPRRPGRRTLTSILICVNDAGRR